MFLKDKLKLSINREKSRIRRPSKFELLGYHFVPVFKKGAKGKYQLVVSRKSWQAFKYKLKELTRKTSPIGFAERIRRLNRLQTGWLNYFKLANIHGKLQAPQGFANLHINRHKEGRTYRGKANTVKRDFIEAFNNKKDPNKTRGENREIVVELIRDELEADVNTMINVVSVNKDHDNWKDIASLPNMTEEEKESFVDELRNRIERGEIALRSQDLNSLKD